MFPNKLQAHLAYLRKISIGVVYDCSVVFDLNNITFTYLWERYTHKKYITVNSISVRFKPYFLWIYFLRVLLNTSKYVCNMWLLCF